MKMHFLDKYFLMFYINNVNNAYIVTDRSIVIAMFIKFVWVP